MRIAIYFFISAFILMCTTRGLAQQAANEGGGTLPVTVNDAAHPCITPGQYAYLQQRINDNIARLHLDKRGYRTTASTTFAWPLMPATGLNDCSYYYIGNYVDEDVTTGIKDYNCGSVTYDGHRGTDICSAPYPFLKMDNNLLNVVAAAPGTIIEKSDGYFDKNCAMSSDTANYIIIQHADGSVALYWHMKKYSLTTKIVGQTVVTGEFLGVVGSSGSSTAPHLHFEVWKTTASADLNDPWTGTCNLLNPATWWIAQKPYTEPAVIKAQVNSIPVVLPGCDTTETPNEDTCFAPGASAKFYIFLRNETTGLVVHERIVNPDGSTFSNWVHNSTTNYLASYWFFTRTLPAIAGTYMYETVYNSDTCRYPFIVNCAALQTPSSLHSPEWSVYPNPATGQLHISATDCGNGAKVLLRNAIGQLILSDEIAPGSGQVAKTYALDGIPAGIYFITFESANMTETRKVIVTD